MNSLRNRFRLGGGGTGGVEGSRRSSSSSRSMTTSSSSSRRRRQRSGNASNALRRYHSLDITSSNNDNNNSSNVTPFHHNNDGAASDRTVFSNHNQDHRTNDTIGRESLCDLSSYYYNSSATFHYDSQSMTTATITSGRRRRSLGRHKKCCGGFCLRVENDDNNTSSDCCLHAGNDATARDNGDTDRFCSFCHDRRREEQRRLRRMEQKREEQQRIITENIEQHRLRLGLMMRGGSSSSSSALSSAGAPANMTPTSGSSSSSIDSGVLLLEDNHSSGTVTTSTGPKQQQTAEANTAAAIPKACCGGLCTGPSYTHCCEHNDLRTVAGGDSRRNGYYHASGIHHGSLIPNFESYCGHCLDRCRQQRQRNNTTASSSRRINNSDGDGSTTNARTDAAVSPDRDDEDICSVNAVRLMPTPSRRSRNGPTQQQQQGQGWEEVLQRDQEIGANHQAPMMQEPLVDNASICNGTTSSNDRQEQAIIKKCLASIECPVCLEPFGDDPCTLPCGHSMCLSHIHNMDRCPICRWEFQQQPQQQQSRLAIIGGLGKKKKNNVQQDWKALAQPSIALRESASAVKEALSFMRLARREAAAAAAKRKGLKEDTATGEQRMGKGLQEEEKKQDVARPLFCQPVTVVNCQWSPPEGHQKVEVMYSDTSCTTTTTSHSSVGEEELGDDNDEERMTIPSPSSLSKRSTASKKKKNRYHIPRIGVSVEC